MTQYHDIELREAGEEFHGDGRGAANQGPSNVLANYNDQTLRRDARQFAVRQLGMNDQNGDVDNFIRAAFVARDSDIYYAVARGVLTYAPGELDVDLTEEEMVALRKEKDKLFNERGITMVNLAVSLAAILQGHVQSSINGASLYASKFGIYTSRVTATGAHQWQLGGVNAVPFFTAAVLGCWLALPVNNRVGRRGGMMVSAVLIFISSLLAGLTALILKEEDRWKFLVGVRIVNGIGMGIKAVSTPILASETAIRFWRGSFVLAWQLWVSFGIMIGFVLNLIFAAIVHSIYGDSNQELTVSLILGAPLIFSIAMLGAVWRCPESPRYYLRGGRSKYDPGTAYEKLKQLRNCELLAMKDIYLLHKTIEQESQETGLDTLGSSVFTKFGQLFTRRRLRNALISTSVVNLSQQLCGINVAAFYSGTFFVSVLYGNNTDQLNYDSVISAMIFSFGFGAVNFFLGLPAFKTIDTLGRRKWLIWTLPIMSFFMLAGALTFPIPWDQRTDYNTVRMAAFWLYLHAAVYSPGLGPIPFTLASESFPLSHRELGCAFAIAVNLGFAGLLTIVFPTINSKLYPSGTLGLFSGFNFIAFVLVYLLVEETKELSLEDLSYVLNVPKRVFIRQQVDYFNWFARRYLLGRRNEMAPEMGNGAGTQPINSERVQIPEVEDRSFRTHSERGSRVSSSRSISPHHIENHAH
ncbi:sugar transporter-domain-containing protein [Xylaria bambusicola]|uniref:sugar transporter-domain-containing protein n=1 Tax=Xylaria bambusicola TaxID=326684 RepID=UPI0020088E9A|nr:sugar transporter-domain-containing protein [Xylaria bambusicola]KAI0513091.1 sugar transporter-domain-containing protein [Xylaria bambusicola]